MKEKFKSTTGITLVALVITIIVLLILVTVTIRIVLSEGIIKRAENAVDNYNSAQDNEIVQLDNAEAKMDQYDPKAPWYELTEDEKKQALIAGDYYIIAIADKGEYMDYVIVNNEENGSIYIAIMHVEKESTSDGTSYIKRINVEGNDPNVWYTAEDAGRGQEEIYKGECPIQMSDFVDQELILDSNGNPTQYGIACKSYLERLIENFNK